MHAYLIRRRQRWVLLVKISILGDADALRFRKQFHLRLLLDRFLL